MRIDIVFDTVCPWCFIGKHRLEQALALRPGVKAELRWRPFLLNPDLPPEGMDRDTYLERKFGSSYRIQRIQGAAQQAGESEGIAFAFERMSRTPNSIQSHRLIQWAGAYGSLQTDLVEAVFRAYFEEGRDISEPARPRSPGPSAKHRRLDRNRRPERPHAPPRRHRRSLLHPR